MKYLTLLLLSFSLLTSCSRDDDNNNGNTPTNNTPGKGTLVYRNITYNWTENTSVSGFNISPRTGGGNNNVLLITIPEVILDVRFFSSNTGKTTYIVSNCNPDPSTSQCRNSITFADKLHSNLIGFYSSRTSLPATVTVTNYTNNKISGNFSVRLEEDYGFYTQYPNFYNRYETITGTFENLKTN